jgi:hypothetical protein
MPSDGNHDRFDGGEYENANAAAKHAHASHRFLISHSFEASPRALQWDKIVAHTAKHKPPRGHPWVNLQGLL